MIINIHRSGERGRTELRWLHSRHSFSFGNYYNPERSGFGLLKVLNDDVVEPGKGFGTHFHDNFEIVSIVFEGALEHRDSMGNHGVIKAGEIQRISAGAGISHSEFNHSAKERVHFLQIWIEPKEKGIKPGYEQKSFSKLKKNELIKVISGNKGKDEMYIHQDAHFSIGNFDKSDKAGYKLSNPKNGVFIFVVDGKIKVENKTLEEGDSAEITGAREIVFKAEEDSKILVIEVPPIPKGN